MISIQNAPNLPDPGSGLSSAMDLLGKSNLFRDMAGLDANQQNAIKTLMSNNESARAYAQMASGMVMQSHNTQNSPQILDSIKQQKQEGAMDEDTHKSLVKSHFQQQIDGGASLKAELDEKKNQGKITPVEAAAQAGQSGKNATASSIDDQGNSHSFSVSEPPSSGGGSSYPRQTLADATVPGIESQTKNMDCWGKLFLLLSSSRSH